MSGYTVTEESVLQLNTLSTELQSSIEELKAVLESLQGSFDETSSGLGAHSEDIGALLEDLTSLVQTASSQAGKMSLKLCKAATIRQGHLETNRYTSMERSAQGTSDGTSGSSSGSSSHDLTETEKNDIVSRFLHQNVQKDVLPHNGTWENPDNPGEGLFELSDDAVVRTSKGGIEERITGKDLKKKYGIKGVRYHHNEPDFYPFVDKTLGAVEVDEISEDRDGKGGTFDVATRTVAERCGMTVPEVKKYMEEHRLTWHETSDRKHILPIPSEINAGFKHSGGISKEQSMQGVRDVFKEKFGGGGITLMPGSGRIVEGTVNSGVKEIYVQKKKENSQKSKSELKETRDNTPQITEIKIKKD